jgi:integrase/recombinase XerD
MAAKRKAPKGCYWRGNTLWGRFKVAGVERRLSLRTDEGPVAQQRLKAAREREVASAHYGDARPTWEDAYIGWGNHIAAHAKPSTVKRYATSLKQIEPFLSGCYLDEIDKGLVSEIVRRRRAGSGDDPGATNATIRRDLTALSSVLSYAEVEGWKDDNPALARLRKLKERRDPVVLPELADIEAVIARAPGLFASLIRVALLTGCRLDELRRLERNHLDFRRGQIALYRTKNSRPRFIDMGQAREALERLPVFMDSQWVFWHDAGQPYLNISSNFRRLVAAAQKAAQENKGSFRPFRFHDLRHRFAVDALKNGMSIYDLQRHLGHGSIGVTEGYLDYLTPNEADQAKRSVAQNGEHLSRFEHGEGELSA